MEDGIIQCEDRGDSQSEVETDHFLANGSFIQTAMYAASYMHNNLDFS